jgi:hypothetical protein
MSLGEIFRRIFRPPRDSRFGGGRPQNGAGMGVGRFRFELIQDMPGLLKLAPAWRELMRAVQTPRHFHSVDWFLALAQTFDQYGERNYFFVTIHDSSQLVGVVPLRRADIKWHGEKLRALQLLSNVRGSPATRDIILADGVARTDILAELASYLDQVDASWDVVEFFGVLEDSCAVTAWRHAPNLPAISGPGGACGYVTFISCAARDTPLKRPSKSFRQNLRTAHNKLTDKEARFVCVSTPDELRKLYPQLVSIEASGWKRNEQMSIRNHPQFDGFLQNLISRMGPAGGCEIHLMRISDRTIAGMFCVVLYNICFIHVISYDEAFSQLSPGHLLIENALLTRGGSGQLNSVTAYHAPEWFNGWKPDRTLQVSNIHLFRPTRRGAELHGRLAKKNAEKTPTE